MILPYLFSSDFDASRATKYLLTVDFSPTGFHTAGIRAYLDGSKDEPHSVLDLGIAFVGLPHAVLPAVELMGEGDSITVEYKRGSWRSGNGRRLFASLCFMDLKLKIILIIFSLFMQMQ